MGPDDHTAAGRPAKVTDHGVPSRRKSPPESADRWMRSTQ